MDSTGSGQGGPGRGWYLAASLLAVMAVVVTGVLGFARAAELVDRVHDFERFSAPGGTYVTVTTPGDYGVYHEVLDGSDPSVVSAAEFDVTVTGPDGSPVALTESDVDYGWGSRRAIAVGEFVAAIPGNYEVRADGGSGNLAIGERIPPGPFRGFEGPLLACTALLLACLGVVVVVAAQRRRHRRRPRLDDGSRWGPSPGPPIHDPTWVEPPGVAPPSSSRRGASLAVAIAVATVLGVGAVMAVGRIRDKADAVAAVAGTEPPSSPYPGEECWADPDPPDDVPCPPTFEEQRDINLAYADRLPFEGDTQAATAVAEEVRQALTPLAGVLPAPSADQVQQALAPWEPDVIVSTNAVRTAGTAFAVDVVDGCVFGSVWNGQVEVEVGGYVNDGGCLASYGH